MNTRSNIQKRIDACFALECGGLGRLCEVPRWKRILDVVLIISTSPLWFPVAFCVSVFIKVLSPGPLLYYQERIGFMGKPFQLVKFRTMYHEADKQIHQSYLKDLLQSDKPMTKLDLINDSRIIPLGNILRALGLDELPQLWNVLKGEMSLVGPRPCIAYECVYYKLGHFRRFTTLPGLTGLWQVNGKNHTSFQRMIELDIQYTRRPSLLLDLSIIFRTIPAIIRQAHLSRERSRSALQSSVPCRNN